MAWGSPARLRNATSQLLPYIALQPFAAPVPLPAASEPEVLPDRSEGAPEPSSSSGTLGFDCSPDVSPVLARTTLGVEGGTGGVNGNNIAGNFV
mmetsp:Transcript_146194/g.255045  ORF Transcript_146194/g.255045 Transcript_146194/m.255045 type:complete len:94 (-) Transcript_146194:1144-1425(-)